MVRRIPRRMPVIKAHKRLHSGSLLTGLAPETSGDLFLLGEKATDPAFYPKVDAIAVGHATGNHKLCSIHSRSCCVIHSFATMLSKEQSFKNTVAAQRMACTSPQPANPLLHVGLPTW